MSSNFILSRLPSFRGISNGPSLISTSNGRTWISTQYFKFKLITDESIDVIANTFLQEMTPSDQPRLKYNFMLAAMHCLLYGHVGDRELTMVMKVERVVNLYYVDFFDYANGFDIVHVSVRDLIDENTCVREARALRYIYTNRFDMYIKDTTHYRHTLDKLVDHLKIQVTRSLSGEKCKVYSSVIPIPYELCEDIFLKFAKNIDFKGRYIKMFKEDRERMLDTIMQFYNEEKKQLDEDANVVESQVINDINKF
ncbi:9405_t:CDS:2 [Dentiscutata erythropus]|uniref:9405_t:CDS:1 n=1 Tax=Dentiscutata erythropus TaxID=1348616 RepID=A0A9N9CFX1_9GLOM|nr:9405_t:CDS:2 [Dentiscutata erythropus]